MILLTHEGLYILRFLFVTIVTPVILTETKSLFPFTFTNISNLLNIFYSADT